MKTSNSKKPIDIKPQISVKPSKEFEKLHHSLGKGIVCETESMGHKNPQNRSPLEIVLDASEGFIPLWKKNSTLKWRFQNRSFSRFNNGAALKRSIRSWMSKALIEWGTAAPVRFKENTDVWDFEVIMMSQDNCRGGGCVLASAFFPDPGRNEVKIYPKLFEQPESERIETMIHEIGHVFGLRHFFAKVSETTWPSEIFGVHNKFSIMNYGNLSMLTADDKNDLTRLYQAVWSGAITNINGTPIRLIKPYTSMV